MSDEITGEASLSHDGMYRYRLTRRWGWAYPLPFVMLNPSTADAEEDDPTIRRCMGFARDMGYGGIWVVNLYAHRATKPADLWKAADPVGPDNNRHLTNLFSWAVASNTPVIAAWGVNAKPDRVGEVMALPYATYSLHHLGLTKHGAPRHPLYLPKSARPEPLVGPPRSDYPPGSPLPQDGT